MDWGGICSELLQSCFCSSLLQISLVLTMTYMLFAGAYMCVRVYLYVRVRARLRAGQGPV